MEQHQEDGGCLNDDSQQEDPFYMLHRYMSQNIELEELLKSGWTREGILLATESEDKKLQVFSEHVNGLTKSEDKKLQLFSDKVNGFSTLDITNKTKKKKMKFRTAPIIEPYFDAQHVDKSKDGAEFGSYFQSFLNAQANIVATSSEKNSESHLHFINEERESLDSLHIKHDDKEVQYSSFLTAFDHSDGGYSDDDKDVDKLAEVIERQVVDRHQNPELGERFDHVVQQLDEGVDSGVVPRCSSSNIPDCESSHIVTEVMNGIIDDDGKGTAKVTIEALDKDAVKSTTTTTTTTNAAIYPCAITTTATTTAKKNGTFKKRVSFADTRQAELDVPANDHFSNRTLPIEAGNNLVIILLMISLVLIYALVNRLISYRQKRTERDMKRKRKSKNKRGGVYYNNSSGGMVEIV